jgi:hypothetical protein
MACLLSVLPSIRSTYLPPGLIPLGRNRVQFVDEQDGRSILLGVFECLSELALGLPRHLQEGRKRGKEGGERDQT